MTAKKLVAVAACCIAHSHVAQSAAVYAAYVNEGVSVYCGNPQTLRKSNGGYGFTTAFSHAYLQRTCPPGIGQTAQAQPEVIFNPASIKVTTIVLGGGTSSSNSALETVVTLRGPVTATEVHVVEGLQVIGPVALSGGLGNAGVTYTPCVIVTQGTKVLAKTDCLTNNILGSLNVSDTDAVTVTVPAVAGKAQFTLTETFNTTADSTIVDLSATSASFKATIYPLQRIVEPGWTYTAAGNFKPRL